MTISLHARFGVMVPVKPAAHAKSRLAPLGDAARRALVTAFAADTVTAALASPLVEVVMVVTDDHVLAGRLRGMGPQVLPDATPNDITESLVQAAVEVLRRWPALGLAALCADLPALDPDELTRALQAASKQSTAFVPDATGDGTTMLAATSLEGFTPRFGPGSSEAHVSFGAGEIDELGLPTLRRDVDTPEDLRRALELGVGVHTADVVASLRL